MHSGLRRYGVLFALLVVGVGAAARPAAAINVTLDYSLDTNGFFASTAARDALELAAGFYEAFTDTLSAITPGGVNTWSANFSHPGSGLAHSISNLVVGADEIIVFAGGRDLPGTTLGIGGPGGFSAGGTTSFLNAVIGRSQPGALGPAAGRTDFGPWGGGISFDTLTSWHFGLTTTGLDAGEADFVSVALHELGHLLGFGTVPAWSNLVSGGTFTGANAAAVFGGAIPLHTGNGHWADGTLSGGLSTLMDPSITLGMRNLLTQLDYAGLQDIGWQVVILAPEPAAAGLLSLAVFVRALIRRR